MRSDDLRGPPRTLRFARCWVAAVGRLLAGPGRHRWHREWDAELVAWSRRRAGRRGVNLVLLRRALLSPVDALSYRRNLGGRSEHRLYPEPRPGKEPFVESLLNDLKFALRSCRKQPVLTAVLLLTMTLGLGGNAAIFSLLHGIVLAPLPYPEPERIVHVWPARDRGLSKELLVRLEREAKAYDAVAAFSEDAFKLRTEGRSEMAYGAMVSAEFFNVLGARPVLGRTFQAGDDRRGPRLALLSFEYWQKRFGADREVLGRVLRLNGEDFQVVGVMERGLNLPRLPFDLAVTHRVEADLPDWDANYLSFLGRLAPGASVGAADAELRSLASRWAEDEGVSQEWAETAAVVSLHESLVGEIRATLYLLCGAAAFILLIVAANVANLLLARTLSREQEISVRAALGATRRRLARQLLTETTALALVGGFLGVALGAVLLRGLKAVLPAEIPRLEALQTAPEVIAFALLLALATGLTVGIVPALSAARLELRGALGAAGRALTPSASRRRLRSGLVVAEVTLAVVLLAGAGVMIKSFWHTLQVDPGFEAEGLVRFSVLPGPTSWASPEELEDYYHRLREGLEAVPGVDEVATVHAVPVINGGWVMGTYPLEEPPAEGELPPFARWRPVSPQYFRTAGIPLLAGRGFSDQDTAESEPVAILNETAARTFFGSPEQALDQFIRIGFDGVPRQRVVGVVGDVKILGLREEAPLTSYRPFPQGSVALHRIGVSHRSMMVRSRLPPERLEGPLQAAVAAYDPFANVLQMQSMEEAIATTLAQPRVVMLLLAAFAGVALLLGAVGIYGVMGYTVSERRREMGIRLALGAPVASILARVLAGGLSLTALGLVLGTGLALVLTRLLDHQLFEVSPTDPLALAAAAAVLLAAALVAVYLPARRAGRVDPVEVLRAE